MSIGTVGVVGLGTMGAGIAQVCLEAGHVVVARDVESRFGDAGVAKSEAGLAKRVEKGLMAAADVKDARGRLTATTDLTALSGTGIVIEAIVEELEPKQALFAELNGICGPGTILATNTSALSVAAVAAASGRPERVVGLHFFNPAPLMKLIEVVRTLVVDEAVFADALAFASGLGKEAVPCADTPGFLVNRILIPILNDAIRAMEETGASPEDIDRAMRFGAGWPMGPFALADLVGLDVHAHASEALWRGLREERMAPPARLQRMVEAGLHGRKAKQGFFDYR